MARKEEPCAYCGAQATTMDHIPPKGLYAKPFPVDLLTVPSCRPCNGGASLDDEYFRTVMSFRFDTYGRSDASGAAERAMQRLARQGSEGFRKGLLSKVTEIPVFDDDGASLGSIGQIDVDLRRLRRVAERIVRGLHFHHRRERLPPECRINVYSEDSFQDPDVVNVGKLCELTKWALSGERHVLSRGVLEYRVRETPEDSACAVWLLGVYQIVPFVVVTAREQPGV